MVLLKVRRLHSDACPPVEEKPVSDVCRKVIGTFQEHGLEFLDGFENLKHRLDESSLMYDRYAPGAPYASFGGRMDEYEFAKSHRTGDPQLFFTPTGIAFNDIMKAGYGNNMLAVVSSRSMSFCDMFPGIVVHELCHSVYGLKHHEKHENCVMYGVSSYPPLCENCQTEARKVDRKLTYP